MNKDINIIQHLYFLRLLLNKEFKGKYKYLINKDISKNITKQVDELVAYIKLNY
jgi:hypothetical protein